MNSNQNDIRQTNDNPELDPVPSSNDNAALLAIPDTTALVAHRDVVRYTGATLMRYGVEPQDMADAIAEVQTDAIEVARKKRMPADLEAWKALCVTIASRWGIDQLREAEVRDKYDAGLSDEADRTMSPTLHWEQRWDPVDAKRYLLLLKEMFDSGQMPEYGEEILQDAADDVVQEETAAELGISTRVVSKRLCQMRARFRARLAALGMLTLLVLLTALFAVPLGGVTVPAPETRPPEGMDAGASEDCRSPTPSPKKDRTPVERSRPSRLRE